MSFTTAWPTAEGTAFLLPTPHPGVGVEPIAVVNMLGDEMKSRSPRFPFGIGEKSHRSAPVSASSATSELEKPVLPAPMQSPKSTYTAPLPASIAADDVRPLPNGC